MRSMNGMLGKHRVSAQRGTLTAHWNLAARKMARQARVGSADGQSAYGGHTVQVSKNRRS